jgi:DNA-directed RNA polymerase subunit E'/Rpb7
MEYTAVFEEAVSLTPRDLRSPIKSLDAVLEGKLRSRLEGKCSRHGFVLSDSVRVLSRSMGSVDRGRFTGNVLFHVQAEGKVLNPSDKTILDGEVIRKNKMGLYLNYRDGIRIQVPRDLNLDETLREKFETIQIGDVVRVTLKKSLFQINDEYILTNGIFIGKVGEIGVTGKEEEDGKEETKEEEEEEEEAEEEEEEEEEAEAEAEENEEAEADEEDNNDGPPPLESMVNQNATSNESSNPMFNLD